MLTLVRASMDYAEEILRYKNAFQQSGDSMDGSGMLRSCETVEEYLEWCRKFSDENLCPEDKVPSTQYFGVVDGRIVGMIDLRHHINHPVLSVWGGHIGYSVQPEERRKGYATQMLRLVLDEARKRGLQKVLLTCDTDNIGSERTIRGNGGVYEKTVDVDGEQIKRFWITL